MHKKLAIIGTMDPEMERIVQLLRQHGYWIEQADQRAPYACTVEVQDGVEEVLLIEARPVLVRAEKARVVRIDHHAPGDPGYGRPPAEYWPASSLGQLMAHLGEKPTETDLYIAAGDHCLRAAYQGLCPGIDPERMLTHRLRVKVTHARACGRQASVAGLRQIMRQTERALHDAPVVRIGDSEYRDMRDRKHGMLPEAAALVGANVLYRIEDPNGGMKHGVFGDPQAIRDWMAWIKPRAAAIWGDPARGFAGARGVEGEK